MYGTSYPKFKQEVKEYLINLLPQGANVLDVGGGDGTYGKLLYDHCQLDTIEIFQGAVEHLKRTGYYQDVIQGDIRTSIIHKLYDLIILGDVIEHMTVDDAKLVIKMCENQSDYVLIAVPYMYQQDALYGNKHEIHLQPDLTPEIFEMRYREYVRLFGDANYGYYIKNRHRYSVDNYD